jgi:hypothetical protein
MPDQNLIDMSDPHLTPAQRLAGYVCHFLPFGDPTAEARVLLTAIMRSLDSPDIVARLNAECDRVLAECAPKQHEPTA